MSGRVVNWWVCVAVLALQGCAIVGSAPGARGGEGVAYMLPRALLPVELAYDGSAYELRVTDPVLVGELKHAYVLQRSGNVFTSDNVTISVNDSTGLLSAVDVKSEDKTLEVISKLVSGFRAEAADAATSVVVFRGLFDPGWQPSEVASFNKRLSDAAAAHSSRLATENSCAPLATTEPCKGIALLSALARGSFSIDVEGGAASQTEPSDCSAGFCYRINIPHVVTLTGPGSSNSAVFGLPNRSPTYVMPLERWAFVRTTHDVKLENGVFKSITTERPSSALALASAPLDIAKAALTAVAEVVQLKVDLSGKEKALAEAKVAEIEAKSALDQALVERSTKAGTGTAEAALLGGRSRRGAPLLAIRVGKASQLDATAGLSMGSSVPRAPAGGGGNPQDAPPAGRSAPGSPGTGLPRQP